MRWEEGRMGDAFLCVIRYSPLVQLLLLWPPPRPAAGVRGQRQRAANGANALWGGRWELGWRVWQMNTIQPHTYVKPTPSGFVEWKMRGFPPQSRKWRIKINPYSCSAKI